MACGSSLSLSFLPLLRLFLLPFFSPPFPASLIHCLPPFFRYFLVLGIGLTCTTLVENIAGDLENTDTTARWWISIVPPFAIYRFVFSDSSPRMSIRSLLSPLPFSALSLHFSVSLFLSSLLTRTHSLTTDHNRGLLYLSAEVSWKGPGYKLDTLSESIVNIGEVYLFLFVEWFILMALWWYLEHVVPSGWGVKKHPLWFLGFGKHHVPITEASLEQEADAPKTPRDVKSEQHAVFEQTHADKYAIRVCISFFFYFFVLCLFSSALSPLPFSRLFPPSPSFILSPLSSLSLWSLLSFRF